MLLCGVAVLLGVVVYVNCLANPFVFDDTYHLVNNLQIRDLGNLGAVLAKDRFRPLVNVMYALEYALWGQDPVGYHVVNLAFHAINVTLLFALTLGLLTDLVARPGGAGWLARRAADRRGLWAFFVAALLAVHPMMSQAVGYISSRPEVVAATCFLAAFWAMRRAMVDHDRRWFAAALVPLVLGLATKEHVAMLPFVVLIYDRLLLDPSTPQARWRLRWVYLPLVALVVVGGALRAVVLSTVEYPEPIRPVGQNLMMQLSIIWRYVFLLLLPMGQSVVHEVRAVASAIDPVAIVAGVALLAAAVVIVISRRRVPLLALGLGWFLLVLAPSSSVVPLVEPMAEHRVYLASCGFFVAAGTALLRLWLWAEPRLALPRVVAWVLVGAVLAPLAAATVLRNRVWADPMTLWRDAAAKAPGVAAPNLALGDLHRKQGDCQQAVRYYRRTISISADMVEVYVKLGVCLAKLNKDDEAAQVFEAVLKLEPGNTLALNNLGQLARRSAKPEQARKLFLQVLKHAPCNIKATGHLVELDQKLTQEQQRLDFTWLVGRCKTNVAALNYLGLLYMKQGVFNEAMTQFLQVEQVQPNNTFALRYRALINESFLHNYAQALRLWRRILGITPRVKGGQAAVVRLQAKVRRQQLKGPIKPAP